MQTKWISVNDRLPECDKTPDSFGVQVLVYPHVKNFGTTTSPIAFYGTRVTDEPTFYFYGAVVNTITHWMPLPEGPK